MGRTPKKTPRAQVHAKGFRRIVRVINAPILAGFRVPRTPEPVCFWLGDECYQILHILKQYWQRPHKYYLVITDRGAFQLCREFRPPDPGKRIPNFQWWLVCEFELYRLPTSRRNLKDPDAPWYWKHTIFPRPRRKKPSRTRADARAEAPRVPPLRIP